MEPVANDMRRYGYTNHFWSQQQELWKDAINSKYKRGVETSLMRYSTPEIEEVQFIVSLCNETRDRLERVDNARMEDSRKKQEAERSCLEKEITEGGQYGQTENEHAIVHRCSNYSSKTNNTLRDNKGIQQITYNNKENRTTNITPNANVKSNFVTFRTVALMVQMGRMVLNVDGQRRWDWSLGDVRRYGYDATRFYFESGRKAKSGEGLVILLTDQGKRIYDHLADMKAYYQFDGLCQREVSLETLAQIPDAFSPLGQSLARGASLRTPGDGGKKPLMQRRSSAPDNITEISSHNIPRHIPLTPQPRRIRPS